MANRRDIPGHPGYVATLDGRILSVKRGKPVELKPRAHHRTGHLRVRLYGTHLPERPRTRIKDAARWVDAYVHVLVCLTWHGPQPEGALVLHLDDDPANNHASNLRWGTASTNQAQRHQPAAEQARDAKAAQREWLGLDKQGFSWRLGIQWE